jgi:hypothetical protein
VKRRRFQLGLLVLALVGAGAIVNVAVAWGLAYYADWDLFPRVVLKGDDAVQAYQSHFRFQPIGQVDYKPAEMSVRSCVGLEVFMCGMTFGEGFASLEAGWPKRSLSQEFHMLKKRAELISGIPLNNPFVFPVRTALPLNPLFPGFPINTVFYASILWMLFAGPGWIRRRVRIKRGLCPACAYPVGSSPVCTECGKPVRVRSVEPT